MTSILRASPQTDPIARPRSRRVAWLTVLVAIAPASWAPDAQAKSLPVEPGLKIAIAPFAGDGGDEPIANQLSLRFARLGVERLLAPGSFEAAREFDPRADVVRAWADQAGVDNVVVGRVERLNPPAESRQVEAVVRSGHSGAELFRHAVHVPARAGLGSALDLLATAIVRDLGGDPLVVLPVDGVPPTPAVSANAEPPAPRAPLADSSAATKPPSEPAPKGATGGGAKAAAAKGDRGLEGRFDVTAFKSDSPIEIKADAAEIVAEGEGRRLVFTGGVWVRQDNLTLRSDFLEAEYVEGESEPRRLVARGAVQVEQGNRSARCDLAEYLRETQKITCRGHAELVQGCDVVRGELIVLDLAANKARVEGAASIVISPKQNTDARCSGAASKP